jgi:hypothetical protein
LILAQHPDLVNGCRRIDCLDHVNHREAGRRDGRQGLHFDTGTVRGTHGCGDVHPRIAQFYRDIDPVQGDRVAQRNEVGSAFRAHDAG